jgi:hypothetical protein
MRDLGLAIADEECAAVIRIGPAECSAITPMATASACPSSNKVSFPAAREKERVL